MTSDIGWKVINRKCDERSLAYNTSVFTISNGYMAMKGDLREFGLGQSPTTIINGLFDKVNIFGTLPCSNRERRYLDPEYFDSAGPSPSVANLPNPLYTRVFVGDRQMSFRTCKVRDFRQVYDLRHGVYECDYEVEDSDERVTRVSMTRFIDMENLHRAYMRYTITPVNHDAAVRVRSGISASVTSNITGERQIEVTDAKAADGSVVMQIETKNTGIGVTLSTRITVKAPEMLTGDGVYEDERTYLRYVSQQKKGQAIVVDKVIALASSLDEEHGVKCDIASELAEGAKEGFDAARKRMERYWEELWTSMDVRIEGDDVAQLYMRFAIYHLAAAATRHSNRLSVPCKLLTGEHYQGTTFYDTDLYIEPLYVLTNPDWARNMLSYRYYGLIQGISIAEKLGYKGAKLAWQSGPEGIECLGDWYRFTKTNIHIDADVAYSLMLYYRGTGDVEFMLDKGIDILVETSRFFASRVAYDEATDRYDISGVTGPDEGHVAVTNDYYTNYFAKRNLEWTCEMLDLLEKENKEGLEEAIERLFVDDEEVKLWREIASKLTFYYDGETKVYEQCKGFHELKPVPKDFLEHRDAWFATVFPYQAMNQPDVVMAHAFFPDEFSRDVMKANWDFYKTRSMNFSSMSYVINSIMAKEMGEMEDAYRDFIISAGMDLDPKLTGRNDTHEGLHGTALGGAWMAAVFGFGGITLGGRGLMINPKLPQKWDALSFRLRLRGEELRFRITQKDMAIAVGKKASLKLDAVVAGGKVTLESGKEYFFEL